MKTNLEKLKATVKDIINKKDVEIAELKKQNEVLGFKAPHFHFSDIVWPTKIKAEIQNPQKEVEIKNFPKDQKISGEVEVKNFPKEFKVEVKNQPKVQDVEIKNWPKQKEIEKPSWISEIVDVLTIRLTMGFATAISTAFSSFGKFVTKLWESGIEVRTSMPLYVIPVDETGKPIDFNKPVRVNVNAFAGNSSGATSAVTNPIDGYQIADLDESTTSKYYGFVNKSGSWYIMKNDTTTNTFRYTKGSSAYPTNWTGRASLTYDYFNNVFNS